MQFEENEKKVKHLAKMLVIKTILARIDLSDPVGRPKINFHATKNGYSFCISNCHAVRERMNEEFLA